MVEKKLERCFVVVAAAVIVLFHKLHFHCSSCCGSLEYYDKTYDRVNVKNEKPLQRIDRIFHTVTTTDDPVIRKLSKTEGNVYATDAILATLMCCTRSNYSWDIVIEKIGEKLFFDKRDNTEFGNPLSDCLLANVMC